jgi:hypothetical protein
MKMSQNEMQKKIEELLANAEFADKLFQCETCGEIAALFETEGIEVSGEELETAMERVAARNENGEIGENDLEQVSGGCDAIGWAIIIIAIAIYATWQDKKSKKNKK